jgi:hypothetical protein
MKRASVFVGIFCMGLLASHARADSWSLEGARYNLECNFFQDGTNWHYIFVVKDPLHYNAVWQTLSPAAVTLMVGNAPVELEVKRFDSDLVTVVLKTRLDFWPASAMEMWFDVNRNTGSLTVRLFGQVQTNPKGFSAALVSTGIGSCSKGKPAF